MKINGLGSVIVLLRNALCRVIAKTSDKDTNQVKELL